jgi:uncharacterized protein (TIGR03066 family)
MKHGATKERRSRVRHPVPHRPAPGKGRQPTRRRWWLLLGLCLVVAGGATWAVFEFFIWNKVPPELVGRWEVEGGPLAGGTFDFSRDGTLEVRHRQQGTQTHLNGRAAVDGKTLLTTTKNPVTKREETHRSTIRELTPDSLVLELEQGEVLRLVRRK